MFVRLWAGLGVPRHVVGPYLARYQADPAQHIAHAWLVGVADPTAALPEGHVFVTGLLGTRAIVALEAAAAARGASDDGGSSSAASSPFPAQSQSQRDRSEQRQEPEQEELIGLRALSLLLLLSRN